MEAKIGFTFEAHGEDGAFITLASPGVREQFRAHGVLKKYIKWNFSSWKSFANDLPPDGRGLDLRRRDIVFVFGTIKTDKWTVPAFQNEAGRELGSHITGNILPFGSLNLSTAVKSHTSPRVSHRWGPPSRWPIAWEAESAAEPPAFSVPSTPLGPNSIPPSKCHYCHNNV